MFLAMKVHDVYFYIQATGEHDHDRL